MGHYDKGNIVFLYRGDKLTSRPAQAYFTLEALDIKQQVLILKDSDDDTFLFKPTQSARLDVEIFKRAPRNLQVGDEIRFTRSDKATGLFSGQCAQVLTITGTQVDLQLTDKRQLSLDLSVPRFQHWDYAYAATTHAVQGQTIDYVLMSFDSHQRRLTTQKNFYTALTRARLSATLFTDDKVRLLSQIETHPGDKTSSLEVRGDYLLTGGGDTQVRQQAKEEPGAKRTYRFSSRTSQIGQGLLVTSAEKAPCQSVKPYWDAKVITEMLNVRVGECAQWILGVPKTRMAESLCFGAADKKGKGSLTVTIQGTQAGLWYDFATGEGGDLLKLLVDTRNLEFKSALAVAARWLGLTIEPTLSSIKTVSTQTKKQNKTIVASKLSGDLNERQVKMRSFAQKLVQESVPVKGTLAESYLKHHRGITVLPENLRFHSGIYSKFNKAQYPALLVPVYNQQHEVQAVQAIFLDPNTAAKASVPVPKQTWGSIAGQVATLNPQSTVKDICFYAEGLETGLSILQALPNARVNVSCGGENLKNLAIMADLNVKHHVLCLDNDPDNEKTRKTIIAGAESLKKLGKTVWFAQPPLPDLPLKKCDFNDVLKVRGKHALLDMIKCASTDIKARSDGNSQGKATLHQTYPLFEKLQVLHSSKISVSSLPLNELNKTNRREVTNKSDLAR